MIPRCANYVLGLLLALPASHDLLAFTHPTEYTLPAGNDPAATPVPNCSSKPQETIGRLQVAALLGQEVPLWLEEAWQQNPQDLQLGLTLLQHYLNQQDNTRTLTLAQQLSTLYPDNPKILKALIISQLANGNTDAALDQANRLTEIQGNSPDAWYLLGLVYMQKADNAAAHRALERAVALDPINFLAPLEAQAHLYLREQKYKEALAIARTVQSRFSALPTGYQLEGDAYTQQREFAKAVEARQTAFSKAPTTLSALALADAQWQSGDQTAAIRTVQTWLGKNPKDNQIRTQLVVYFNSLQRYPEAIAEAEKVLKQEPDNGLAVNNLAALYHQIGDKRALQFAERALQLAPDSPDAADTLGWILVQSNQLPRGIELLQQAVAQKADDPQIRYHLASAYAKAGRREEALQQLDQLQQANPLSAVTLPQQLLNDMQTLRTSLQRK